MKVSRSAARRRVPHAAASPAAAVQERPELLAAPPLVAPPVVAEPQGRLYGLVAWPSSRLDCWLRQVQERLNVRAYGEPHLNLRAPFRVAGAGRDLTGRDPIRRDPTGRDTAEGDLAERDLICALRALVAGQQPFEVQVTGWRFFPHVVFLECEAPALTRLHEQVLALPGAPLQLHDQHSYIPHLTLALGLLPWSEAEVRAEVGRLTLPETSFTVSALSLTREDGGELREVHTFPLGEPPVGCG